MVVIKIGKVVIGGDKSQIVGLGAITCPFKVYPMLIGEYRYKVGLKNRVALPKKLRDSLGEHLIVLRGYEGSILVVSKSAWDKLIEEVLAGPLTSEEVRDTARFLMGGAHEVGLDEQGRFVVPPSLIEYADISVGEEIVFIGLGRWVEIWKAEKWEEKRKTWDQKARGEILKLPLG